MLSYKRGIVDADHVGDRSSHEGYWGRLIPCRAVFSYGSDPASKRTRTTVMDDPEILVNWRDDAFRCDSFQCQRSCCTYPTIGSGIPVSLNDLLRLRNAGLLASVEGHYMSQAEAQQLLASGLLLSAVRAASFPHVAKSRGSCVHYDASRRSCTIHPSRPRLCRAFPYETNMDGDQLSATFSICCSLVEGDGYNARLTPPNASRSLQLADNVYGYRWRRVRLSDLAANDRAGVRECQAREREERGTVFVIAHHAELLERLELGAFLHPDDRRS